jgi:hypothetical protein
MNIAAGGKAKALGCKIEKLIADKCRNESLLCDDTNPGRVLCEVYDRDFQQNCCNLGFVLKNMSTPRNTR